MKQFEGLTTPQSEVLYDFLNEVCTLDTITYWSDAGNGNPVKAGQPCVNREIALAWIVPDLECKPLAILQDKVTLFQLKNMLIL